MKLIKSSYEILPQAPGLEGVYKQIEVGARCCYRSEGAIKEGSAEKMVQFLKERLHYSPLEHGTVYLHITNLTEEEFNHYINKYNYNPYSKVKWIVGVGGKEIVQRTKDVYITSNLRVLVENG